MPHYDYVCAACEHKEEFFQKITDHALEVCPSCKNPTFKRKPGGGGALLFRCSGFYETDYNSSKPVEKSDSNSTSSKSCCPCSDTSCSN